MYIIPLTVASWAEDLVAALQVVPLAPHGVVVPQTLYALVGPVAVAVAVPEAGALGSVRYLVLTTLHESSMHNLLTH